MCLEGAGQSNDGMAFRIGRDLYSMSSDLRNSILLWVCAATVFGIFFAGARLGIFLGIDRIPRPWIAAVLGGLAVANLVVVLWGICRRRAPSPTEPDLT